MFDDDEANARLTTPPTDWNEFYSHLTAPTSEFYDKLAKIGMSVIMACVVMNKSPLMGLMLTEVTADMVGIVMDDYSIEVITGMIEELHKAQTEARVDG